MAIDERYLVCGKSALDGQLVEGYLIRATEDNAFIVVPTYIPFDGFEFIPIDLASVKPVKVKPSRKWDGQDLMECLNCGSSLDNEFCEHCDRPVEFVTNYSPNCGMALDWNESISEEEAK